MGLLRQRHAMIAIGEADYPATVPCAHQFEIESYGPVEVGAGAVLVSGFVPATPRLVNLAHKSALVELFRRGLSLRLHVTEPDQSK